MVFLNSIYSFISLLFQVNLLVSILWIITAFVLLLIEIALPGFFFFISFACGCLIASFFAFLHEPFSSQIIAWLLSTTISFFILRRFSKKGLPHHYSSNYNALIGKKGTVIQEIKPFKSGRVKIRGESWAAITYNETISRGTSIRVLDIKGNKVIVQSTLPKDLA